MFSAIHGPISMSRSEFNSCLRSLWKRLDLRCFSSEWMMDRLRIIATNIMRILALTFYPSRFETSFPWLIKRAQAPPFCTRNFFGQPPFACGRSTGQIWSILWIGNWLVLSLVAVDWTLNYCLKSPLIWWMAVSETGFIIAGWRKVDIEDGDIWALAGLGCPDQVFEVQLNIHTRVIGTVWSGRSHLRRQEQKDDGAPLW